MKDQVVKLREKQKACFDAMIETMTDENVAAYKAATKVLNEMENQIAEEDKKTAKVPEIVKDKVVTGTTYEEQAVQFMTNLREAVAVGSDYTGLVPSAIAAEIVRKRESFGKFRPLARKMSFAGDYTVAIDGDQATASYATEAENLATKESTPTLNLVTFSAYKLVALVKVSNEFLEDLAVDAMGWLTDNIARAFAKKEDAETLNGLGSDSNNIEGILTKVTTDGDETAEGLTYFTLGDVKDLIGALGEYKDGAVLVMHPTTKTFIKKMQDSNKQFYFPIQTDVTEIEGCKIVLSSDMEEIDDGAGARVILAANMNYYQLVDRKNMNVKVLNELLALNDQKAILGIERVDGKVLLTDAFKVLKMNSSDPE